MEVPLGQDVDDVGQCQHQGHLGEARVPQPRHHHHERATADEADERAAEEGVEEGADRFAEGRLAAAHQHLEQHGEEDDRRGVVEQAFALDQPAQATGRAEIAEDGDHRRGIGRGDDRRQQQTDRQRHPRQRPERQPDHGGGHQDRDHRQQEDRRGILEHAPDVDRKRRLEQQRRQEDVQHLGRRDREVEDQLRDLVERVGQLGLQKEARDAADKDSDRREEHRGRQVQPSREGLQQADHHQQASHGQQRVGQTEHAQAWSLDVSGFRRSP